MAQQKKAITTNSKTDSTIFGDSIEYIPPVVIQDFDSVENPTPKESAFVIFKLQNNNQNGKVRINGQDEVINPKTGEIDTMFLLQGISEIWGSELRKKYSPEFLSKHRREDMIFDGRILRIPSWDKSAIEFMRHNRNHLDAPNKTVFGKNAFFEYNPQRQAEALLKKETLMIDAIQAALELDEVAAKKLALFYGLPLNDEVGELKPPALIKKDLAMKAKENAEKFLKLIKDPIVEVSFMVGKAILENKIDISTQAGKAYFANGGFIVSIPSGTTAKKHLVEFATSETEAGKEFLANLKKCLIL